MIDLNFIFFYFFVIIFDKCCDFVYVYDLCLMYLYLVEKKNLCELNIVLYILIF